MVLSLVAWQQRQYRFRAGQARLAEQTNAIDIWSTAFEARLKSVG